MNCEICGKDVTKKYLTLFGIYGTNNVRVEYNFCDNNCLVKYALRGWLQ